MGVEATRNIWGYIVAILILAGAFYGLVPYEYQLDDLTKGALIALATLAANWVFGTQVAANTARQQQAATAAGAQAGSTIPTTSSGEQFVDTPPPMG